MPKLTGQRLQLAEAKKTAEWDEKMKLGNQWRGLGAEELDFLAKKAHEKRAAEKKIEDQEKQDVAEYREYVVSFSLPSALAGRADDVDDWRGDNRIYRLVSPPTQQQQLHPLRQRNSRRKQGKRTSRA